MWSLIFRTGGISYTEWMAMDFEDYQEAKEAYLNYIEERNQGSR